MQPQTSQISVLKSYCSYKVAGKLRIKPKYFINTHVLLIHLNLQRYSWNRFVTQALSIISILHISFNLTKELEMLPILSFVRPQLVFVTFYQKVKTLSFTLQRTSKKEVKQVLIIYLKFRNTVMLNCIYNTYFPSPNQETQLAYCLILFLTQSPFSGIFSSIIEFDLNRL